MRGKDWPVWRIKASLRMPANTRELIRESRSLIVGPGPAGLEEVPALVKALSQDDPHIRREAVDDLGLIAGAAEAVPALLRLARHDPDPLIRVGAAKAVASIDSKNESALPLLVEALKDKTGTVRKKAAESLGDLGRSDAGSVSALARLVKDADPTVRWAAIDALGQIGPEAAETVPLLLEALQEASLRGAAVDALGQIGRKAQPAVPALQRLLEGDEPTVRWAAAAALVRIGGAGLKPGVRFFLTTVSSRGGKQLYEAEIILVGPPAREALRELLEAVRDPAVRDTATRIVQDKSFLPLTKDQIADVKTFLPDADAGVRCVAAWVLFGRRGQPGVTMETRDILDLQQQALKSSDPWARRQAARFLGALGPYGKEAVPALSAALKDRDEDVRGRQRRAATHSGPLTATHNGNRA